MLRIFNSYSRKKEVFNPIEDGKVKMYVCGMTVYDYCHLGHARVLIAFDTVYRYLMCLGYDVTYIRNVTDIDDNIIKRAAENKEDFMALTKRFTQAMHDDCEALAVLPPTLEPRATDNIPEIIEMISVLITKGYAYSADNGDVYYKVKAFESYGQLSGRNLSELRAGERVAIDEYKQDPLDFVLWKSAKEGEPSWSSPWGEGRPGWHIECSAMSTRYLGKHFDIHGGGMDLKFPHHENEIAQSEAATDEHFVNYWMHNGFIRVDGEKMSKSLGNFFTIRDVLESFSAEEVRFFILSSHYRSPLNYADTNLINARASLTRLYTALRGFVSDTMSADPEHEKAVEGYQQRFNVAMNDDFNTPEAFAILFEMASEMNRQREVNSAYAQLIANKLRALGSLLGILGSDADEYLRAGSSTSPDDNFSEAEIEGLISQRSEARSNKDWGESDRIRDLLDSHGVTLEDTAATTTWRRK